MNRRQLFFSTAKAALATAFGGSWLSGKAQASAAAAPVSTEGVVHGVPGSPSATVSVDGRYLPPTPPPFGGTINLTAPDSTPWWPAKVVPPEGAPNVLLIMTDDAGYGVASTFGGVIPTPALDRIANAGLRYTQFHSTALCSPTRAALITGRNHHSVGFGVITEQSTGFPGYDSIIGPENVTVGRILREHGYATSWFGKEHNTPSFQYTLAGPFDQWPVGMGFEYFYGFMGGETDQWTPYLFRNTTQIFPWLDKPGYNLITDMADEAIKYMRELNAAEAEKPFFLYYVPGGTHAPHQPTQEWIDKFKGKFDMGWNALRDQIFCQPEAPRRDPGRNRTDPLAGGPAEMGDTRRRQQEIVRPPGRGIRRLRCLHRPRDRPRHPGGGEPRQARQHPDHLHRRRRHRQLGSCRLTESAIG
jgi:hypothetical protein